MFTSTYLDIPSWARCEILRCTCILAQGHMRSDVSLPHLFRIFPLPTLVCFTALCSSANRSTLFVPQDLRICCPLCLEWTWTHTLYWFIFHAQLLLLLFVVQLLSHVRLFGTSWTAAHQTPLSFTISTVCSNSCLLSQWCYLMMEKYTHTHVHPQYHKFIFISWTSGLFTWL